MRKTLAPLLALLLAAAAPKEALPSPEPGLAGLLRRADALLSTGNASPARATELREALAAVPRAGLPDDEWIDLHVVLAALDRVRFPPAEGDGPAPAVAPAAAEVPAPSLFAPDPDPARILDAAATCRRLRPAGGTGPAADVAPFAAAAKRARAFAAAARAFATDDPLLAAAAAVAAECADDLVFDLDAAAAGRGGTGAERFEWILRRRHGLDLGVEEVRAMGEAERDRVLAEMEALAAATAPGRTWRELTEAWREDRPGSTAELLGLGRKAMADAMARAIESGLVTVPEAARRPECELLGALNPAFPTPWACYNPGGRGADGYQRGVFRVTPLPGDLDPAAREAWLRDRDPDFLRVIAGHEAVPGHHLQFTRAADVDRPLRRFGYTSTYVEGWGLYSEDLMDRAGAFVDAPARMALLRMRLWRAVRVLIDVGLNTGDLRPSDAVAMLVDDVMMDRWTAKKEVERYLVSPTQPLSYLVGYGKIRAMRAAWLARRGAGSERAFNDAFLALGPIPLDLAAAALLGKRSAYDHAHP